MSLSPCETNLYSKKAPTQSPDGLRAGTEAIPAKSRRQEPSPRPPTASTLHGKKAACGKIVKLRPANSRRAGAGGRGKSPPASCWPSPCDRPPARAGRAPPRPDPEHPTFSLEFSLVVSPYTLKNDISEKTLQFRQSHFVNRSFWPQMSPRSIFGPTSIPQLCLF